MKQSRLDLLTKRLIKVVKDMNEDDLKLFEGQLTMKEVNPPNWIEIKTVSKIIREYAIGKRMDKLQRLLYSGESKTKNVEIEMKKLMGELVEMDNW